MPPSHPWTGTFYREHTEASVAGLIRHAWNRFSTTMCGSVQFIPRPLPYTERLIPLVSKAASGMSSVVLGQHERKIFLLNDLLTSVSSCPCFEQHFIIGVCRPLLQRQRIGQRQHVGQRQCRALFPQCLLMIGVHLRPPLGLHGTLGA